ncbi:MAG: hypothetical protein ACRDM1_00065 [Gaiellaceae bacterium]
MKAALVSLIAALALAAALAPAGSATNECHGITACIRVPGPWVLVPPRATVRYLLACPGGRSVVGGVDAQVTSRDVRVGFEGRIGAPVQPGITTTRYALFRAVSISRRPQAFQPLLGCIPTQGGGGRSTVSARISPPGPSLEFRSRIVIINPGELRFAKISCKPAEQLAGSWDAIAFRVKKPPRLQSGSLVNVTRRISGKQVVVTAAATDGLSIDVRAVVQVGAECAP